MPTSDRLKLRELFKQLTKQIHANCKSKQKVAVGDGFNLVVYTVNDISLYVDPNKREMVAIEFVAFNKEVYFTPQGEFQIEGDGEVMDLDDPEVIKVMSAFLEWRLSSMVKLSL